MTDVGIIRVLTSDDQDFIDTHGRVLAEQFGIQSLSRCIPDQPTGIHDDHTEQIAVPKIITLAGELLAAGVRRLLISCAADPALAQVRTTYGVPTIGAGSAGAAVALAYGNAVGVLGITADVPPAIADLLGDRLIASRVPTGVTNTTDLLTSHGWDAAIESAHQLVAAGAQVILFACTGLTTIGIAAAITAETGVPVIDAVMAAGLMLSYP